MFAFCSACELKCKCTYNSGIFLDFTMEVLNMQTFCMDSRVLTAHVLANLLGYVVRIKVKIKSALGQSI